MQNTAPEMKFKSFDVFQVLLFTRFGTTAPYPHPTLHPSPLLTPLHSTNDGFVWDVRDSRERRESCAGLTGHGCVHASKHNSGVEETAAA